MDLFSYNRRFNQRSDRVGLSQQEGLAVDRIARDDGSLAQTFLQLLRSYAVRTFPLRTLRTSVTQILLRVLYVGSIRTMWRRFRPMW